MLNARFWFIALAVLAGSFLSAGNRVEVLDYDCASIIPERKLLRLEGTNHLWVQGAPFLGRAGSGFPESCRTSPWYHWVGDTRALSQLPNAVLLWDDIEDVSLPRMREIVKQSKDGYSGQAIITGSPILSAGLLKDGDPIYLVKWETDWAQPRLLHIQSIEDVELFGINGSNYGNFVIEKNEWERRFGISAAGLQRGTLPSTSAPGTVTPTPISKSTPEPSLASGRAALVALYNATGGANWGNNRYWLSDAPIHLWHGVQTDENGRVTKLELDHGGRGFGNNLVGVLPAELGHLTHLEVLKLSNNNLTGPLPAALGNLIKLKVLELYNNDLTGPLPAEIGNLTNLEVLDFYSNFNLSGPLPQSLTGLTRLTTFKFGSTKLCPPANSTFRTWLQRVTISTPSIWYGCHVSQQSAATDRAALVALYNATDGKNWRINRHWLSDEPIGLWHGIATDRNGHVTSLKLKANNLTGPLPAELGNLTKLEVLLLSNDRPEGAWNNNLEGPLPAELGNLTRLKHLYLANVNLTGSLPAELGNLANLTVLFLRGNHLTGPLPAAWGNLTKLDLLYLDGNDLIGPIPAEWGNLTRLRVLELSGNDLSGPLPHSLTGLTRLKDLILADTRLCVPADSAFEAWTRGIDQFYGQWGCPAA